MRNHGHITVGHSVEEAVAWFIRMERACEQTLLARAAGKPHVLDHDTAALTASQIGSHRAGWYGLQPLVDKVLAEQPDVLN
jgi:ribulose-5-phosphate 4-epimerase/fuculose-1-phosphate aldolase